MSVTGTVHILDGNLSRRASIARGIFSQGMHAEVYEGLRELMSRPPCSGFILAFDEEGGPAVPEIVESAGGDRNYVPVAMYSDHLDPERIVGAMLSGALDYLAWPFDAEALERSLIRMNTSGNAHVVRNYKAAEARSLVGKLTGREREVLRALLNGASNKDMAKVLGISPRTVEIHRGNMMRKLNASTTSDAVRIGLLAEADT